MWIKRTITPFACQGLGKGDCFVLWGYGATGKAVLRQCREANIETLVAVVDAAAADMEQRPDFLQPPEYLREHSDFDKLYITADDSKTVRETMDTLHDWGVPDEKVHIAIPPIARQHRLFVRDALVRLPSPEHMDAIREQMQLWSARGRKLVRVGNTDDGGYVMMDDFHRGGIAYSFGISQDVTWDCDMAERGYDVFMYDHTIDALPEERPAFHFFRKGIAGKAVPPNLDTLAHYVAQNHHAGKKHMILKMDVEGAEWDSLLACSDDLLRSFDQIVLELHDMVIHEDGEKRLEVLRKLNQTHAVVHVHANNWGKEFQIDGRWYTDAWEVTYANRSVYDMTPGGELYTELDTPCCSEVPEVYLFQQDGRGEQEQSRWEM